MENPELMELLHDPQTIDDLDVPQNLLIDILLRLLYNEGNVNISRISQVMRVPVALESLLEWLKEEHLVEVSQSSTSYSPFNYVYKLTGAGSERARDALERSQYVGPVPVPVQTYCRAIELQTQGTRSVTVAQVQDVIKDLVLPKDFHRRLGPAINMGSSLFLYGPSGNGKTTIAQKISTIISSMQPIWLPFAITAGGQIIQIYDRLYHNAVPVDQKNGFGNTDGRWGLFYRPSIIVGGEMKMESLELRFDPISKIYEAPLQVKANGGMFLIDDFGRQQISPTELLNRWILPLENGIDHMRLRTGQTMVVPFRVFIVFSTNLDPYKLGDDAFYRRVQMKVAVSSPDEENYREIFINECNIANLAFDDNSFEYLCNKWYRQPGRTMAAVHPRDLIKIIQALCAYENCPPDLTPDHIDEACMTYFVEGAR